MPDRAQATRHSRGNNMEHGRSALKWSGTTASSVLNDKGLPQLCYSFSFSSVQDRRSKNGLQDVNMYHLFKPALYAEHRLWRFKSRFPSVPRLLSLFRPSFARCLCIWLVFIHTETVQMYVCGNYSFPFVWNGTDGAKMFWGVFLWRYIMI